MELSDLLPQTSPHYGTSQTAQWDAVALCEPRKEISGILAPGPRVWHDKPGAVKRRVGPKESGISRLLLKLEKSVKMASRMIVIQNKNVNVRCAI